MQTRLLHDSIWSIASRLEYALRGSCGRHTDSNMKAYASSARTLHAVSLIQQSCKNPAPILWVNYMRPCSTGEQWRRCAAGLCSVLIISDHCCCWCLHPGSITRSVLQGTLTARRKAQHLIRTDEARHKLFTEMVARYKLREGGYTRIMRTQIRRSDGAQLAYIECALLPLLMEAFSPALKPGGLVGFKGLLNNNCPYNHWSSARNPRFQM